MIAKQKIFNLYEDTSIFSIRHIFSINSEEDLNQFWNFFNVSNNTTYELPNIFVAQFYNFALSYLINNTDVDFFEIILEESEKDFYFTLRSKKITPLFKVHLQRTSLKFIYNNKNKISIKLKKSKLEKMLEKISSKNEQRQKNLITSINLSKNIEPYTFIEINDLEELLGISEDMIELMSKATRDNYKSIFISIRSKFSLFCLLLRFYDKIAPMATVLTCFSNLLNQNRQKFTNLNTMQLDLISGFINNIDYWLQTLFINGGADIYFMDNSINADYKMIAQMINPSDEKFDELALDEVFNF